MRPPEFFMTCRVAFSSRIVQTSRILGEHLLCLKNKFLKVFEASSRFLPKLTAHQIYQALIVLINVKAFSLIAKTRGARRQFQKRNNNLLLSFSTSVVHFFQVSSLIASRTLKGEVYYLANRVLSYLAALCNKSFCHFRS